MQNRAQFDDRIRNLIALAQEGSSHSRTLLFSHICDLFLQKRPLASAAQSRMLSEILKELLDQVALPRRQEIAQTLATLTAPPPQLIDILCEDVVAVSGPLLEKAILPDDKLIHIIRYGSQAHRIHISRRFGLSPLVRNELEKAGQENRGTRKKYSLNELDKRADPGIPVMDEDTTAHILEVLRAQKIHDPEIHGPDTLDQEIHPQYSGLPDHENHQDPAGSPVPKEDISGLFHNVTDGNMKNGPVMDGSAPVMDGSTESEGMEKDAALTTANSIFHSDISDDSQPVIAANDAGSMPDSAPVSSDSIIQMTDISSDLVDDLRQQARDFHHETNRRHEFMRAVSDWFWETDRSGAIGFVSEEASAIFGRPTSDLVGMDFNSLCETPNGENPADTPYAGQEPYAGKENVTIGSLFERRTPFRNIPFYVGAVQNGQRRLWYLSAVAIFDIYSGRFSGFRGSARQAAEEDHESSDLPATRTDRPQTSPSNHHFTPDEPLAQTGISGEDIRREEKATELLHNLSHEFRTPLNAIIGFSEMMDIETWGPMNEEYHQNTKNMLAASIQLKEAVNDVLDSARLESGLMQINPESFSLKSVIIKCQDNISSLANEKNVSLMDNHNNIDVILYNDKQSVELCLTKMLTFIIKRARGGEVVSPAVLINSSARVRIELPVPGPRIDKKDAENLFQALTLPPSDGENPAARDAKSAPKISATYGLSIARNLARMIGGDISAYCSNGYVSHIVLTLSNHEPAS